MFFITCGYRIGEEMQKHSYFYTWDQIQNKWKSLIRTYKNVRDHNNETGRSRKTWPFFEKMDELFQKNPTIDPPLVIHNGKTIHNQTTCSKPNETASSSKHNETPNSKGKEIPNSKGNETPSCSKYSVENNILEKNIVDNSKKLLNQKSRKEKSELSDLLKQAIDQSEIQHKEDLEEKKKFNKLLERLVEQMEKKH